MYVLPRCLPASQDHERHNCTTETKIYFISGCWHFKPRYSTLDHLPWHESLGGWGYFDQRLALWFIDFTFDGIQLLASWLTRWSLQWVREAIDRHHGLGTDTHAGLPFAMERTI